MSIWCASDIHGKWGPLAMCASIMKVGDWLLFSGEFDLVRLLGIMVFALIDRGINVRWVAGNHDFEDGLKSYEFLREGDAKDWGLHYRAETMDGLHIAGLSGTYSEFARGSPSPYGRRVDHLRAGKLRRDL